MSDNGCKAGSEGKSERPAMPVDGVEGLVGISLRITRSTHRKIMRHKFETGESMTTLINRLLEEELG